LRTPGGAEVRDWIGLARLMVIRSGACLCSSAVRIRSGHVGGCGLGLADLGEPRHVSLRISVRGLDFTCAFSCDFTLLHIRTGTVRDLTAATLYSSNYRSVYIPTLPHNEDRRPHLPHKRRRLRPRSRNRPRPPLLGRIRLTTRPQLLQRLQNRVRTWLTRKVLRNRCHRHRRHRLRSRRHSRVGERNRKAHRRRSSRSRSRNARLDHRQEERAA